MALIGREAKPAARRYCRTGLRKPVIQECITSELPVIRPESVPLKPRIAVTLSSARAGQSK
jgi:hypothetical protein